MRNAVWRESKYIISSTGWIFCVVPCLIVMYHHSLENCYVKGCWNNKSNNNNEENDDDDDEHDKDDNSGIALLSPLSVSKESENFGFMMIDVGGCRKSGKRVKVCVYYGRRSERELLLQGETL